MFCFPQVSEHYRAEPWKPRAEPEHAPEKAFEKTEGPERFKEAEGFGVILRSLKNQFSVHQTFFFFTASPIRCALDGPSLRCTP